MRVSVMYTRYVLRLQNYIRTGNKEKLVICVAQA